MKLFLVTLYFKCAFSFNIDTDFPIVFLDPFKSLQKHNILSSYFGYSLVLHKENSLENSWIQIGAPRANSTVERKQPGLIYRCKIFGPCYFIDVHPYFMKDNLFKDKKDGAWIGATMDIEEQSGRVVVCGHRLMNNRGVDYWLNGACYWSHINDTIWSKMVPLHNNDMALKKVGDAGGRQQYLFYYAQGQAGFSAQFSASKNMPELLLGAPGVYNWDGTTVLIRDGAETPIASRLTTTHLKRQVSYAETPFGEFSDVNIANAYATTQTGAFSLLGFSVTSGYFFDESRLLYASGAPRSKTCTGQILVFEFSINSDEALDVKDLKQGDQHGEYFGASLAAGDINNDGYDDLIVGAPFYTNRGYNEGRIFIFLGDPSGKLQDPKQNSIIRGTAVGGQFGNTLLFLGDLHADGFAAIAIAAPYEDDSSGVLYIYRGNPLGMESKYCQRIAGKQFVPNIRGFGISISRPTDVDGNDYKDIAVGAYLSGHAVLLRSRPVVTLRHTIIALTPQLDHNAEFFEIRVCFWYHGNNVHPPLFLIRKIGVDEVFHRAYLSEDTPVVANITLINREPFCEQVMISLDPHISNRYDPIRVTVSQELVTNSIKPETLFIGEIVPRVDNKFCKSCPVLNNYTSTGESVVELSFALGCGDDNVCQSNLNLESKFLNIGTANQYVLGSTNYLKLEATITNEGELAYLTRLQVNLPKSVYFRSISTNCIEGNSSSEVVCGIDNPLEKNKPKSIVFDLDMKEVSSERYGNALNFTLTLLTTSENLNKKNVYYKALSIVREADIALTGKTSQQSYSYGNITNGKPNFTQIYQIEKIGASPIEEVSLTIKIPTHIYGVELINFLYLYPPEGYHAGQPINCQSNIKYLINVESYDDLNQFASKVIKDDKLPNEKEKNMKYLPAKRAVREVVELKPNKTSEYDYPLNRTFYINCSNSEVICSIINCTIGPFKIKQNIAVLQLKMLFDTAVLKDLLGLKDIVILSTEGMTNIKSPSYFVQSGNRSDIASVASVFIGEKPDLKIETWHIIVAVICGVLLLLLLIMGLIKAGFFQRKKKKELQALKEADEAEKFKRESMRANNTEVEGEEDEAMTMSDSLDKEIETSQCND